MKTAFLLVLCFALYCGLSDAHGRSGHRRGNGRPPARPGMMGDRPQRFRFQRMKKLFREHKKNFGNKFRALLPGQMGNRPSTSSRPNVSRNPFQKLKMCKLQCQNECMDFNSCRQTCQNNCDDVRVPSICKLNCLVNDCISSNCTDCHRACFMERSECQQEYCAQECSAGRRGRRMGMQCKRCVSTHCSSDDADEEETEEREEVEESDRFVDLEDMIMEEIGEVEERLSPLFRITDDDSDSGDVIQAVIDLVERRTDE